MLPSGHATSMLEVRRVEPAKRLDGIAVERWGRRRVTTMAGLLRDVNLPRIGRMPIGSCSPRHAGGAEDMDVANEEAFSTGVAKCRSSTGADRQFEPSCRRLSRAQMQSFLTSDGTSTHVRMATANERAIKSIYKAAGWDLADERFLQIQGLSKAAGHALMRHVAATFGPEGVRANSIAHGMIMHEKWEAELTPQFTDWLRGNIPLKARFGRPSDIASVGTLLMSDEGAYITGQVINVDGGLTMRA